MTLFVTLQPLQSSVLAVIFKFVLSDSPSPTAARTLTLVAKSVQNLANLVEFGAKVNTNI